MATKKATKAIKKKIAATKRKATRKKAKPNARKKTNAKRAKVKRKTANKKAPTRRKTAKTKAKSTRPDGLKKGAHNPTLNRNADGLRKGSLQASIVTLARRLKGVTVAQLIAKHDTSDGSVRVNVSLLKGRGFKLTIDNGAYKLR